MSIKILKSVSQNPPFSKEDTLIFKGIGILLIVLHNFFHWISPYTGENEFDFQLSRVNNFVNGVASDPLEFINLFFSYFGHFGVQIFFFFSAYGLMRAYGSKQLAFGSFIGGRLKKLYPAYILAILLFIIYNMLVFSRSFNLIYFRDIFLQLTFLNNFVPGFIFRMNGPWWFYSVIVQLYLLFPILVRLNRQYPRFGLYVIFTIWILANAVWYEPLVNAGINPYYTFSGHLPVFLLGMIWAKQDRIQLNLPITIIAIAIFILGNYNKYFWYFSQAAVVIILVNLITFWPKKLQIKGFGLKGIIFYGSISMYLFAVHGFLRKPLVNWANNYDNAWISLLLCLLFLIIATIVALGTRKADAIIATSIKKLNSWRNSGYRQSNYLVRSLRTNFPSLFRVSLAFYLCLVAIRFYEVFLYRANHVFSSVILEDFFMAISIDLALSLGLSAVFVIIYSMLPFRKAIIARTIHYMFLFVVLIVYIGTIQYYNTTLDMLDHVVYVYSVSALTGIASSSTEVNLASVLPFILAPIAFIGFAFLVRRWKASLATTLILIVLSFYFLLDHNAYFPKQYQFKEMQQYDFANNKVAYFGKMLVDHRPGKHDGNIRYDDKFLEKVNTYQANNPEREYLSQRYPYLYKIDHESTLRPYFDDRIDSIKPNIVLLVVESLSASLSGDNARYSSFTPFLDSLARHSLYWPNTLSTSERTFGALPSLLGSLPPANTGFAEMADSMPPHLNLISLLKQNDYTTLFFYGGWAGFNNMEQYLNTGFIDYIETEFTEYEKMPSHSDGFTWGYGDKELFKYSLDFLEENITEPYLSIYLTLSNHHPFMIHNEEYYEKLAWEQVLDYGLQDDPKYTHASKLKALKTHIYTDLTIRDFLNRYQERDDFENTIFIITGDHITFAFPRNNRLETYHVPLIIYSPLLKKAHESKRLVSHLDLVPSIQQLLQGNDSISFPEQVHWIGQGLDTTADFGVNRQLAMMSGSREISDFVYGDKFISGESLYKIEDNLSLELLNDADNNNMISTARSDFDKINQYACNNSSIYPYNLYTNWLKVVSFARYRDDFDNDAADLGTIRHYTDEAYSGARSLLCDTSMTYSHILPETIIKNEVHKLNLRLEMMVKKHHSEGLPSIVVSLHNEDGEVIFWRSLSLPKSVIDEPDKWHHFSTSLPIRSDQMIRPNMVLKVFFWNQHNAGSLIYDNVEVDISGML